ncbi:MAG TPA: thioesterase family protein [Actinomycetota bacterium]|nr:thioesterase family protein [Actinomycetota bacterium]
MHERRIEIRWSDMDAYGHVNNAVYLHYLEEVRDEWFHRVLGGLADTNHFVLARVAIDFRSELKQEDGAVLVRCRLARVGGSSVATREEILKLDGTLSAEAESVTVARDPDKLSSRPLTDAERAALGAELRGDQSRQAVNR